MKACFNAIENNKSLIFVAGNMIKLHPKQSNTWTSSIIIGVLGYAFVMLFGYFISSAPDRLIVKPIVPVVQEMEVELEEAPAEQGGNDVDENSMMSEAVRNLIASTESARVNEEVNYTGDENKTGNAGEQGDKITKFHIVSGFLLNIFARYGTIINFSKLIAKFAVNFR